MRLFTHLRWCYQWITAVRNFRTFESDSWWELRPAQGKTVKFFTFKSVCHSPWSAAAVTRSVISMSPTSHCTCTWLAHARTHSPSRARSHRLKAHVSSTPPRKQPEAQDDPPHLRRNAEPPRAAEKTVIRNAPRTVHAGKGAAAAPEVRMSRKDIKSMMFSIHIRIIILLTIILSSVRTEPHGCLFWHTGNRFYHIKNFIMQPIWCDLCLWMFYKNGHIHTDITPLDAIG